MMSNQNAVTAVRQLVLLATVCATNGTSPAIADDEAHPQTSKQAQAFTADLFKSPLRKNWSVRSYSWRLSANEVDRLRRDDAELRQYLASRLEYLWREDRSFDKRTCVEAAAALRKAKPFLDRYPASFHGKYAFALWFTKFDQDNWFSFEQIAKPIERYLDAARAELVLFKRVKPYVSPLFRTNGLFDQDLPVVISPTERSLSVFAVELFD